MIDPAPSLPFDLNALQVFLAVCDLGSMSGAARRIGITQPSVSQVVAELEARLAARLFDRRVRPLALTQAGVVLRQRASVLLADARQIGALLHQVRQGKLSRLRVGLVDSLSRALTAVLAGFMAEVAEQSSLLSGLTAAHATSLITRQLDLFLGAEELEDLEGLERHVLLEEPYVLLCPASMPPPPADAGSLAAWGAQAPLLRFSARSRTGIEIERHLRRLRLEFARVQEFDTPFGIATAVAGGLGWAITTPLCIAEAAVQPGRWRCHTLAGPSLVRRLVLVAREGELGALPQKMALLCRANAGLSPEP